MKLYDYEKVRTIASSKYPIGAQRIWQNPANDDIFFVDATDDTQVVITRDEGSSIETADVGSQAITAIGATTNKFYMVSHDVSLENLYVEEIDLTGDTSPLSILSMDLDPSTDLSGDVFLLDDDIHVLVARQTGAFGVDNYITLHRYDESADTWHTDEDVIQIGVNMETQKVGMAGIVGNDFYCVVENDGDCYVLFYDKSTTTFSNLKTISGVTLPNDLENRWVVYDSIDNISFLVNDSGTLKYKTYNITDDEVSGDAELDAIVGSEKLFDGDERGFDPNDNEVYKISKNTAPAVLYLISTFDFDDNIAGITDNYIIDDSGNLYKVTDKSDEFSKMDCQLEMQNYSKAELKGELAVGGNQVIEIYDDDDSLLFRGRVSEEVGWGSDVEIRAEGLDKTALNAQIDLSYSSSTSVQTIVQAAIDEVSNYLYYTNTSIPDPSISTVCEYESAKLVDVLDEMADIIDGIWYITPNGKVYLHKITSQEALDHNWDYSGTYSFGQGGNEDADDEVGDKGTYITFVDFEYIYEGNVEIVADWQNHANVLEFTSDERAGYDPFFTHNISQATSGTREFRIGATDITSSHWIFGLRDGEDWIVRLRFYDSALDYYDGSSWIEVQSISADAFYNIKIQWYSNDTFDLTVEDTLQLDGIATHDNQSSGVDTFFCWEQGDSTGKLYLDAWGDPDNDDDYSVGDNRPKLSANTGNISLPKYKLDNTKFNYIHLYGRNYIESDGDSKDQSDIDLNGKEELIRYYKGVSTLSELQNIASQLINRDGINTSPITIDFQYENELYIQPGKIIDFVFNLIDRLNTLTEYTIKRVKVGKDGWTMMRLSNSTFQEGREYE
jgi:hypothetical protein